MTGPTRQVPPERAARDRQDTDYRPPVLAEPVGGPIPAPRPFPAGQ